jgi:hypothetical protein
MLRTMVIESVLSGEAELLAWEGETGFTLAGVAVAVPKSRALERDDIMF